MPQKPARLREALPLEMRVYGAEGQISDLDEAVATHATSIARADERLNGHDVLFATLVEQMKTVTNVTTKLTASVDKLLFAVVGSSLGIAASVVIAAAT